MSTGRHIVPSTVPRLVRHAERSPLLTRLPVIVIAGFTMIAALLAGVAVRLSDPVDFRLDQISTRLTAIEQALTRVAG
jgi:hypothetical protein